MTILTGGSSPGRNTTGLCRREFLKVGAAGALGLCSVSAEESSPGRSKPERSVIMVMLVGGPSQLETFDPKPDAPADVRGPFRSIATTVPGVRVIEHLPRLARRMSNLTLVRTLNHEAAPIHEAGQQLIQTGCFGGKYEVHPHIGSVAARQRRSTEGPPPFIVLPGPIGATGFDISHGQSAGTLGAAFDPVYASDSVACEDHSLAHGAHPAFDVSREPDHVRRAYGHSRFGLDCLRARRLVEAGTRVVVINMYDTVFDRVSWDCHGSRPFSTLDDYARESLPTFDMGFSALLDDLDYRGRLGSTLVVATGEFGRTPRLNAAGGRDHWPGAWSAAMAGGGIAGGRVIGASDSRAGEPIDRPVTPAELVATIYYSLQIDVSHLLDESECELLTHLKGVKPIAEALA